MTTPLHDKFFVVRNKQLNVNDNWTHEYLLTNLIHAINLLESKYMTYWSIISWCASMLVCLHTIKLKRSLQKIFTPFSFIILIIISIFCWRLNRQFWKEIPYSFLWKREQHMNKHQMLLQIAGWSNSNQRNLAIFHQ